MTHLAASKLQSLIRATVAILGLAISATAPAAFASSTQSFQISPPTANYAADPGGSSSGIIKVTNLTDTPMNLSVGRQNFVAKGEEGEIELVDNADPLYSLAPWFNITASTINVAARATKEVHYSVNIPKNAEPGGRYGSIIFSSIPAKLPTGVSGASVVQTIAAIIFERINGKADEQLEVTSFASEQNFYEYGPVKFLTRIKDTGSIHEKATGTITIKNMFGLQVDSIPLDEHFVIPGSIRRLHNSWPATKKSQVLFGNYTATLNATYADGKKLTATTSFTVLPWRLLIIVFVALVLIFLIFWRGRKRFARAARILAGKE